MTRDERKIKRMVKKNDIEGLNSLHDKRLKVLEDNINELEKINNEYKLEQGNTKGHMESGSKEK